MSDPYLKNREAISRLQSRLFDPPDTFCMCEIPCERWSDHKEKIDAFEARIADEAWDSAKEKEHGIL